MTRTNARQLALQLSGGKLGRQNGIALVIGIESVQKLPFLADQHQLGGGGTGVDA